MCSASSHSLKWNKNVGVSIDAISVVVEVEDLRLFLHSDISSSSQI